MKTVSLSAAILMSMMVAASAQAPNAYRYSGQRAGGPASDLIPSGTVAPIARKSTNAAYRYSGQRAGGPASDLIPRGEVAPAARNSTNPAYRYSGQRAGGPANDLIGR